MKFNFGFSNVRANSLGSVAKWLKFRGNYKGYILSSKECKQLCWMGFLWRYAKVIRSWARCTSIFQVRAPTHRDLSGCTRQFIDEWNKFIMHYVVFMCVYKGLCLCLYVCVVIYGYVCVYILVAYVCVYTYLLLMCVYECMCLCLCVCACTCIRVYVYIHTSICIDLHICGYTYLQICIILTFIHTCACVRSSEHRRYFYTWTWEKSLLEKTLWVLTWDARDLWGRTCQFSDGCNKFIMLCMCVYIKVCVCSCMCVCIHGCVCVYILVVYVCVFLHTCCVCVCVLCLCLCIRACTYIRVCIYIYTSICTVIHICGNTHIHHTDIHTYIYLHMCVRSSEHCR